MRTISEIYEGMVAEKNSHAALQDLAPAAENIQQLIDDLTSSSKVAIWRLLFYIMAVGIFIHETLFDVFKKEVDEKAESQLTGNLAWYQKQVLLFQYGDDLVYDLDTLKYSYEVIDEDKKIVARCAVQEVSTGFLNVKVAKEENSQLVGLIQAEQDALISYIKKVRLAGTRFTLFSGNGDELRVPASIYYDPLIPLGTIKINVKAAINNYINSLPFDGEFKLIKLVDSLQGVTGVSDAVLGVLETRPSPADGWTDITRSYNPKFGYFKIDTQPGYTLNDTLQYLPV